MAGALALDKQRAKNQASVVAHVDVIEAQKRGHLHCHLLVWMEHHQKPRSVDDYDKVVSAELPDNEQVRKCTIGTTILRTTVLAFLLSSVAYWAVIRRNVSFCSSQRRERWWSSRWCMGRAAWRIQGRRACGTARARSTTPGRSWTALG